VNTTGEVKIEVGQPVAATAIPLVTASIAGSKATLFVIDGDAARKATFAVQGEQGSDLFVDTALKAGTQVVTEGRATLRDGDPVAAKVLAYEPEAKR
jgi:hypothetical protein